MERRTEPDLTVCLATRLCRLRGENPRNFAKPSLATIYLFQNPWEGMRNARLKREDAFSQAMIIVSSAMVSSS